MSSGDHERAETRALDSGLDVTSDPEFDVGARSGRVAKRQRPPARIGNYEVMEWLGQGGMGTVFRARHVKLDKEVALKLIRPVTKSHRSAEARFDRELRAVGKLDHPNIVRALDAGEFGGVTFLSMELLQGVDLDEATAGGTTLELADACEVIRQAALGLQYVHENGLVHRDIKPSNLMLARDAISGVRIKVMDLGLALIKEDTEDERITDEGIAIGTFRYMSLEQARNTRSVDHRADIYSLGATFFRLLAGTPPYSKQQYETHAQLLMALMSDETPDIASVSKPDVPAEVTDLIKRMLARDPDDRPQDLLEVIEVLSPFAQSHQLESVLERSRKRVDRESTRAPADQFTSMIDQLVHAAQGSEPTSPTIDGPTDDLGVLRQRVRRFWVDGVLSRTKDNTQLLPLSREFLSDCVTSPWEGIAENPLQGIDANVSIDRLFQYAEQSLLILGDPGSGKSTTLLELAEHLLRRSESSHHESIPVLLHLSSWDRGIRSFDQWVVQELNAKYQIPVHIGRRFVEERRLILLLDGMDEVRPSDQRSCVESLNQFTLQMTPPGVAVCSRYAEYVHYIAAGVKLRMYGAVRLKPLTSEQIMTSISGSTGARRPLLEALGKHRALLELASCPLMLNMMKTSYDDSGADSLDSFTTIESARAHLFDTFVAETFRSKDTSNADYTQEETLSWLTWIAKQMQSRNQTVFLMDELQPDWLVTPSQRWSYLIALSLIMGSVSGLTTMYFWYRLMPIMDTAASTPYSSLFWLMLQLPVWWLMVGCLDFFLFSKHVAKGLWASIRRGLSKTALYSALWMIWPLGGHLTGAWTTGWTVSNVLLGLLTGASIGILGRRKRVGIDVDVAQPLGISLLGSFRGWVCGFALGFVIYATYLCLWALYLLDEPPDWFPYFWLSAEERNVSVGWPLAFSSVGLVAGGLVAKMSKARTAPNQGLGIYFRNTIMAGLFSLVSVVVAGSYVLVSWLNLPDNPLEFTVIEKALLISGGAIWTSFFVALSFGALDLLKHGLTRLILKIDGVIPRRLPDFLKHASRLGLLRRVGGAHIFSHGMLLDYFADREKQSP